MGCRFRLRDGEASDALVNVLYEALLFGMVVGIVIRLMSDWGD